MRILISGKLFVENNESDQILLGMGKKIMMIERIACTARPLVLPLLFLVGDEFLWLHLQLLGIGRERQIQINKCQRQTCRWETSLSPLNHRASRVKRMPKQCVCIRRKLRVSHTLACDCATWILPPRRSFTCNIICVCVCVHPDGDDRACTTHPFRATGQ